MGLLLGVDITGTVHVSLLILVLFCTNNWNLA